MKRLIPILLVLVLAALLVAGCSNPDGRIGPSWDVPLRLPGFEEFNTIGDLINVEDFESFSYEIEDENDILFTLHGTEDNEVKAETEVELNVIELGSIEIGSFSLDEAIALNNDVLPKEVDTIEFDEFEELTLSDKSGDYNQLEFTLENTGDNKIENLEIELQDKDGNYVGQVQFTEVSSGAKPDKEMNLANETLADGMKMVITDGSSDGEKVDFELSIKTTDLEVTKLVGYSREINEEVDFTTELDIGETAQVSKDGDILNLKIDLKFPEESNLKFDTADKIKIGEKFFTKNDDGYYQIKAEDENIDLNDEMFIEGTLKSEGDTVTYNAKDPTTMEVAMYGDLTVELPEDIKEDLKTDGNFIVYEIEAAEFEISSSDLDRIDEGIKEARLVTESVNYFPVDIIMELYIHDNKEDIYTEGELIGELANLKQGSEKHEFILDKEKRDKFRDEPVYVGLKISFGDEAESKVTFESDQDLTLETYAVLVTKVNQ